jgi:protoporphyrinogen oxidase
MINLRWCILGAGPSGLTFANALKDSGETSYVLLEREREAGGLCRSVEVDGKPLDIGGGHFLDVSREHVLEYLFRFMPRSEWAEFSRIAKIRLRGVEIDHPLEANLWQLPIEDQIDFLESIAQAGVVRGSRTPNTFDAWIRWKLGDRIAEEYMLPYNRKMWNVPLDRLGIYWLYKLPSVSFRETLQSCLERSASGTLPAHGVFLYPKNFGYGEVWRRMADVLGNHFVPDCPVVSIDWSRRIVNGEYHYERLVSTIPWPMWRNLSALSAEVDTVVSRLEHTSVDVDYHVGTLPSAAQWTYEPDERIAWHRYLLRHNFCAGAPGYWTETNSARSGPASGFRHRNEYAYPISTWERTEAVLDIHRWASSVGILPLGRWGNWEHMNSDVAVENALQAAHAAINS